MADFAFRIVNVFAQSALAGNALAVIEDARGLDDDTMQALALQFNLSETTFILPSAKASARVRIFTPTFEMPFAGHPTLGTAHVLRSVRGGDDDHLTLDMLAGIIPVDARGDVWTLSANAPKSRPPAASRAELAAMLGLDESDVAPDPNEPPLWIDTGSEQLIVPLASPEAVTRSKPSLELLMAHGHNGQRALAYVFARPGDADATNGATPWSARFFFLKYGAIVEDPGTGSACANLGGWLIATGATLPQKIAIGQGDAVGRPCRLGLEVTADARILVSGRVVELARGTLSLPATTSPPALPPA